MFGKICNIINFVSSLRQRPPMNRHRPYRPQTAQTSADIIRADTCDTRRFHTLPTAANSSFTFSAKERDPETGLSYFGSRYYSSDLSVWLSVDPQSDKYASLSPYVYCVDNPVKLVDPDGED